MTHINHYSQRGCVGCAPCEGGTKNIIRNLVIFGGAFLSGGFALFAVPFFKKCQFCGHRDFMNAHFGPHPQTSGFAPQQQPTAVYVQAPPAPQPAQPRPPAPQQQP